jgi:hypothetical protein
VEVVIVAIPGRSVPDWKTLSPRWFGVWVELFQALMNELAVENMDSIFTFGRNDFGPEVFLGPFRGVGGDDVEAFFVVAVSAKNETTGLHPLVCLVEVRREIGAGDISSFEALQSRESTDDSWAVPEGAGGILEQGPQFLRHGLTWNVEPHGFVPPQ